jgi:hypothetical protein
MPKRPWVAKNKIFSCLPEGQNYSGRSTGSFVGLREIPIVDCPAVQFRTVVRSASLRKRVQHSAASVALGHPIARPKTFQLQIGKHMRNRSDFRNRIESMESRGLEIMLGSETKSAALPKGGSTPRPEKPANTGPKLRSTAAGEASSLLQVAERERFERGVRSSPGRVLCLQDFRFPPPFSRLFQARWLA